MKSNPLFFNWQLQIVLTHQNLGSDAVISPITG